MTYSLYTQCHNCKKRGECKDEQRIQEGVNAAHGAPSDEHLGGGMVVVQCVNQDVID